MLKYSSTSIDLFGHFYVFFVEIVSEPEVVHLKLMRFGF